MWYCKYQTKLVQEHLHLYQWGDMRGSCLWTWQACHGSSNFKPLWSIIHWDEESKTCTRPETNSSHLKSDGWNRFVSFWDGLLSGVTLVSGRVYTRLLSLFLDCTHHTHCLLDIMYLYWHIPTGQIQLQFASTCTASQRGKLKLKINSMSC